MVLLAPPSVVDAVVVVSGAGDCHLEEIRIFEDGSSAHETAAGVAVDAHPLRVDERMSGRKLLYGIFLILETIVAQIAVAVVVVPLRTVRMAAAVAHGDDNHPQLGEPVGAGEVLAPGDVVGLHLRTRIDIVADRIDLCRVEVIGFVHRSVEVGHSVCRLDLESFGESVAGFQQQAQVGSLEIQNPLPGRGEQSHCRGAVYP